MSLSCTVQLCLQWTELPGEREDVNQDAPLLHLFMALFTHRRRNPAGPKARSLPVSPGGPVRSCFLSHLAGGPIPGSTRPQGQRWWCGVWGTPLAFTVPFRGWWCPMKPSRKLFSCPEEVQSPCGCWHRGGGTWGRQGEGGDPPASRVHTKCISQRIPLACRSPFCSLLCLYMIDN